MKKNKASLIYWLGGSTCAGKTTISNAISAKYGFTVYHCDDYLGKHIEKSNEQEHPNLNKITEVSWNDILNMSVEEYLNWITGLFSEEFGMILEDLEQLPDDKPILVEGINLLPKLIKDEVVNIDHAVWLVAEDAFYKKHQMERKELFERIKECSNQEQALQNYMNDDFAFGKYILNDAEKFDLKVIEIVNESDIKKNIELISRYFKLVNKTGLL
jgi:2-phosphoglycerate kinase